MAQRVAWFFVALVEYALSVSPGMAQVSANPDISVIPRFVVTTDDGQKLDEGKREFSRPDFAFQELEIGVQSYLNPFSRADIFLTVPGPEIETAKLGIEEVFATVFKGLPLDLNIRFGKYRVEYGKINMVHPHAWPFVTQPFSQQRFLGEDGLNDLGISVSALLPVAELYTRLTLDLLRGLAVGDAAGIIDTTGEGPFYASSARLMTFLPLSDASDLEIGLSSYTGIHDPYNRDRFWYLNLDCKYKFRPSAYCSLTFQGEYLFNTRTAHQDQQLHSFLTSQGNPEPRTINTSGFYLFADYQFFKIFFIGARYDWSQAPYSSDDRAEGVSLFLGYYPVEESLGLRLQYQYTRIKQPEEEMSVNMIALQALFSLGPHKAHPF